MKKLRVVVKVGTGVLTRVEDGCLDGGSLVRLVTGLAELMALEHEIVLVSSGAVGSGVSELGLSEYPEDLVSRQAAAAVGQARLMHTYGNLFSQFGKSVAQILLTGGNLKEEEVCARVSNTVECLLEHGGVVPIVNQNDSVAVEELSQGDNDKLSVRVAKLLDADLLIMLTSVDGLCRAADGVLVSVVSDLEAARAEVQGERGKFSIGGMASKLEAVSEALDSGLQVVIGNGRNPERLQDIVEGRGICTRFSVDKA